MYKLQVYFIVITTIKMRFVQPEKYKPLFIKTNRTARGVLVRTYISGFRGI